MPLNYDAWHSCLQAHPDKAFVSYILSGLTYTFHTGLNRSSPIRPAKGNMREHPETIEQYIQSEVEANRIIHTSIIPKRHQPGKWRLIVDMSSPEGTSVNDGLASSLTSLSYIHIEDVIKQIMAIGKGNLRTKIDIKSAHCIIPVHPSDCWA